MHVTCIFFLNFISLFGRICKMLVTPFLRRSRQMLYDKNRRFPGHLPCHYIYHIASWICNTRMQMLNEENILQVSTTKCLFFNNYERFFLLQAKRHRFVLFSSQFVNYKYLRNICSISLYHFRWIILHIYSTYATFRKYL